jgi:hypothetical protein
MSEKKRLSQFVDPSLLGTKDAIHTPVAFVRSEVPLDAGDRVSFRSATEVLPAGKDDYEAIVDPLLNEQTDPSVVFAVLIRPELVAGLRHEFDVNVPVLKSAPTFPQGPAGAGEGKWAWITPADEDYLNDSCRGCYD